MDSVAMPVLENSGFSGAGMYENLNKDADEQEQLIKLEK